MNTTRNKLGFSLVEVAFAVLVVGLGCLTIFSLFPSGLRMANADQADTKSALFVDRVFSGLHSNAGGMTNAADWVSFEFKVVKNVLGQNLDVLVGSTNSFPLNTDDGVRYYLTVSTNPVYSATLKVWYGQHGSLVNIVPSVSAYTEFYQVNQVQ